MKQYLFSYGTLQTEKTQVELFGRIIQGAADTLRGYKNATIEITDQSFLSKGEGKYQQTLIHTKEENDLIKGTVLELTNEEILKADKYEPENYKRIKVILESGKETWIYTSVDTT
ncbi:hypothetical protein CAP36_13630 [Chitinophagaceae bacterium IBVUCB2]|nr:hypothetical protein CAP36_13630 [Chitinophagaceae bacterium IBVUCB2]